MKTKLSQKEIIILTDACESIELIPLIYPDELLAKADCSLAINEFVEFMKHNSWNASFKLFNKILGPKAKRLKDKEIEYLFEKLFVLKSFNFYIQSLRENLKLILKQNLGLELETLIFKQIDVDEDVMNELKEQVTFNEMLSEEPEVFQKFKWSDVGVDDVEINALVDFVCKNFDFRNNQKQAA